MAKESQQERQLRIAREGLARAVAASNADEAAQHLVQLPAGPEREAAVSVAGRLIRAEVLRAFAGQKWDRLGFFAARVSKEPRLVDAGAEPVERDAVRWALLWGAIKGKVWPRAEAQLAALRPVLAAPLAEALAAVISHQGSPPLELQRQLPAPPEPDPRLGYDPRRAAPRAEVTAPATAAEVDERVLALFATCDWASFAETIARWAEAAPDDVGRPMRAVAASLSVRELLTREGERALEPARFLCSQALAAGAPPELLPDVRLALRRVFASLSGEVHDVGPFNALAAAVRVAVAYPDLRPLVKGAVPGIKFDRSVHERALELLGVVFAALPSAELVWRALRLAGAARDHDDSRTPKWLVQAIESQLDRGTELGDALGALEAKARVESLRAASMLVPIGLAERLVDHLWVRADVETREDLAMVLGDLLNRETRQPLTRTSHPNLLKEMMVRMAKQQGMDLGPHEIEQLFRSPEGKVMKQLQEELGVFDVGSSRVDLQACKLEYSIVSPK